MPTKNDRSDTKRHSRLFFYAALLIIFSLLNTLLFYSDTQYFVNVSRESKSTEGILRAIKVGIALYHTNTGNFPSPLTPDKLMPLFDNIRLRSPSAMNDLRILKGVCDDGSIFIDGWKQPIILKQTESGGIQILSTGKDKMAGTPDDMLENWTP